MKRLVGAAIFGMVLVCGAAVGQMNVHAAIVAPASRVAAPAVAMPDGSGKTVQLSDYRGKVVLLNFWATQCGGCKIEIPWFIAMESAHTNDGFTVVGVSMDTSYGTTKSAEQAWSSVKPFVAEEKMNYPILMGDYTLMGSYKLRALPATFLIDKQGRVAATYGGVVDKSDVEANVKTLLAEQ